MNDAVRVATDGLLTTAQLAARPDFTLGLALVSPSTRTLAGPGGTADVEPRIMQVLVVLADSAGGVVTRETLFQRCWGGVYVGDDSLNRAIAGVRKLATGIAGNSFEIETIPRTGYRLAGLVSSVESPAAGMTRMAGRLTRRQLAGGALGAVALGGAGLWMAIKANSARRFDQLMARGEADMRKGAWNEQTAAILKEAISIRPHSAKALGLLALLKSGLAQAVRATEAPAAVEEAEAISRSALAIDPKEPNALLAMFKLQGSTLDWAARDRRLRQIIGIDPTNLIAIGEIILLLQAAGLSRESWNWNERALALEPLSVDFLSKRALKLWLADRTTDADKVIDQVRALYPNDPGPWWVRFIILALTGRAQAAQAMLDPDPGRIGTKDDLTLWRAALDALQRGSPASVSRARAAAFEAARVPGGSAGEAVMILSALGQVDSAFDVANGFLLSRGSIVRREQPPSKKELNAAASRINTQWLFTPPCKILRTDPRFMSLCDGLGLAEYWRRRRVRPDYQLELR